MIRKGKGVQRAEAPCEGHLLFHGNVLVAEEHDFPLELGGFDEADDLLGELSAEIDVVDHSADGHTQVFEADPKSWALASRAGLTSRLPMRKNSAAAPMATLCCTPNTFTVGSVAAKRSDAL
eukprot:CAMPEP_0180756242 /NCGR_PEP_ID=MMETSP1038_2-20121128/34128_1 /TAXON_ID=632150 /ORGANISM="Azadinium spinosum, Strain 3D9" /LENGTH=121 /DNA_ID=CAMNT_0022790215 /DNA_START=680 /DNA_END=1046 /DNA_ORIENTATION=+